MSDDTKAIWKRRAKLFGNYVAVWTAIAVAVFLVLPNGQIPESSSSVNFGNLDAFPICIIIMLMVPPINLIFVAWVSVFGCIQIWAVEHSEQQSVMRIAISSIIPLAALQSIIAIPASHAAFGYAPADGDAQQTDPAVAAAIAAACASIVCSIVIGAVAKRMSKRSIANEATS